MIAMPNYVSVKAKTLTDAEIDVGGTDAARMGATNSSGGEMLRNGKARETFTNSARMRSSGWSYFLHRSGNTITDA
jgi:hypothetical protein